jgi:cysteinyl-tRNA synthetase
MVGRARLYVCGITPYDTTHLGHAATFVWTDVVARVLRAGGLEATVVRNVTDVDDDMLDQARSQGVPWRSLATRQTYRFDEDMRALGVAHPAFEPRSHDYVDEVIALAAGILDTGAAYVAEGTVWFRGANVPAALGLSGEDALEQARTGGHRDLSGQAEPFDVPVWQRSEEWEPSWPSPWGQGRPGWHAECAAMSLATLGSGLDVHGGGADLAFPHHAYEAALAEAATGVRPFARAWLHVGTVNIDGQKMAKSAGNLVFVHDLLEAWPPGALRLLLLDRPWHEPWEYDEDALRRAEARWERLRGLAAHDRANEAAEAAAFESLWDDLGTERALAIAEEAGGRVARRVGELLGVLAG